MKRKSRDVYYMQFAESAKALSTCKRRQVGACIVKDNHLLSTGYNGAPKGLPHCTDIGCTREKLNIPSGERQELCRAVHAEQNAILQSHGKDLSGSTIYITTHPCVTCAKLLINAGISRIVYSEGYPDSLSVEMLNEAGIEITKMEG